MPAPISDEQFVLISSLTHGRMELSRIQNSHHLNRGMMRLGGLHNAPFSFL